MGLIILTVISVTVAGATLLGRMQPGGSGEALPEVSVEYITEDGRGASEALADSPLRISVRLPWQTGARETLLSLLTVEMLDENGNPARFGEKPGEPKPLGPTPDIEIWENVGSVPSVPGAYFARVQWQRTEGSGAVETRDLRDVRLTVLPRSGEAPRNGYVFNRNRELWIMSADAKRQRRLTFSMPIDENAEDPAWSPDGSQIAYAFAPKVPRDQIPVTELWLVKPDGTGGRRLLAPGPNEAFLNPYWSADGKYLYFTVETAVVEGGFMVGQSRRIDRLEVATGARSEWIASGLMPALTGSGNELVYMEEVQVNFTKQRIVRADPDSGRRSVLVSEETFVAMYGPRMSPDGKWVIFSATVGEQGVSGRREFDFLGWLLFKPQVVEAHDVPWDIYMVPATGGTPTRLTTLNEDQPHPIWLDSSSIAFMGVQGLHKLQLDAQGKPVGKPVRLTEGNQHSSVTWRAP